MNGPFHAITCGAEWGCDPTCERARADNLPRDPDLCEVVYGQLSIEALEEDELIEASVPEGLYAEVAYVAAERFEEDR